MESDNIFREFLDAQGYVLADGAMGTNLFLRDLTTGEAPELWNVTNRQAVASIHREFIDAGSDVILTNSFGGSSARLRLHGYDKRVEEFAIAAGEIARGEADKERRKVLVAGSLGPTGELLYPLGTLTISDVEEIYEQQAKALVAGGADLLWIETIAAKDEVTAAITGASRAGRPVVSTMTFDSAGKTMMGLSPRDAYVLADELPLAAFGANCGLGMSENLQSVRQILEAKDESARPEPIDMIISKANCGVPKFVNGTFEYTGTPENMADYACVARDLGVAVIGGCCGTTGEILAAMKTALETRPRGQTLSRAEIATKFASGDDSGLDDQVEKKRVRRSSRRRSSV